MGQAEQQTIEYSTRDDCPGTFFRCDKMSATITVASCSRMWAQANEKGKKQDPCDRLHHCQLCPIGAKHSGVDLVISSPLYGARICSRCNKPSRRLINDEYCPSCYNRQREVLIGRNGKGTKPVKHPPLEPRHIVVVNNGKVSERKFKQTTDMTEVFVSVLRHTQGSVLFAFSSRIIAAPPSPVQLVIPL